MARRESAISVTTMASRVPLPSPRDSNTYPPSAPSCEVSGEGGQYCPPEVRIICVGVMRTGLKTLHKALRNLGYSNIYDRDEIMSTYNQWNQVMRNNATTETFKQIFKDAEVIMGLPTYCFWEQIVEIYPDAQVILTVRDEHDWWKSVSFAKTQMQKDLPGAPLRYGAIMRAVERFLVPSYHNFCEVLRFAWAATLGAHALEDDIVNEAVARSNYRKHNAYVKAVLTEQKTSEGKPRLLVYNVKDGWDPLCDFLGQDSPEVDFPKVKHVSYWPGQQTAAVQAFENMTFPQSDLSERLRRELRWGVFLGAIIIVLLILLVVGVLLVRHIEVPLTFVAMLQVVVISLCLNVYVVLHGLITRVPALLVLPMAVKSLLIVAALQASFISYGILKEMLVMQDHVPSPVLVLSSRFGAIICSTIALYVTEGKISFAAPLTSMAAFAFTNEASTWAGYEMLKYVSFPVQVMAKSTKMLPSMLMGRLLDGTRYTRLQYLQAVAALICVALMHLTDDHSKKGKQHIADDDGDQFWFHLGMGLTMLSVFFVCDSFTSQWQGLLYKQYPAVTQTQMMLGGNLIGFLFTSTTFVAAWSQIQSAAPIVQDPAVFTRIVGLGVTYASGQFCVYSAIRILGPLSFTWIMTARQLASVLISLLFFGHGINVTKVTCILVVFGIMSAKQLTKVTQAISEKINRSHRAFSASWSSAGSSSKKKRE